MAIDNEFRATPESFAAEIVAAYVSNNTMPAADLPALINTVRATFASLGTPAQKAPEPEPLTPAVSIRRSVTPDVIVCLECGKGFKSLKRHLSTNHDLTPDEYRQRWSLAASYPMVAPNYADARSQLALSMGLGRKRGADGEIDGSGAGDAEAEADAPMEAAAPEPMPEPAPAEEPAAPAPQKAKGARKPRAKAEASAPEAADEAPEVAATEESAPPKRRGRRKSDAA